MEITGIDALRAHLKATRGASMALARNLKISPVAVTRWKQRVPAERVLDVERATGISRTVLRPDLYPAEDAGA